MTSAARYSMTAARYTGAAICSFLTRGHQYGDDKSPKNECMCVCVCVTPYILCVQEKEVHNVNININIRDRVLARAEPSRQ